MCHLIHFVISDFHLVTVSNDSMVDISRYVCCLFDFLHLMILSPMYHYLIRVADGAVMYFVMCIDDICHTL